MGKGTENMYDASDHRVVWFLRLLGQRIDPPAIVVVVLVASPVPVPAALIFLRLIQSCHLVVMMRGLLLARLLILLLILGLVVLGWLVMHLRILQVLRWSLRWIM